MIGIPEEKIEQNRKIFDVIMTKIFKINDKHESMQAGSSNSTKQLY